MINVISRYDVEKMSNDLKLVLGTADCDIFECTTKGEFVLRRVRHGIDSEFLTATSLKEALGYYVGTIVSDNVKCRSNVALNDLDIKIIIYLLAKEREEKLKIILGHKFAISITSFSRSIRVRIKGRSTQATVYFNEYGEEVSVANKGEFIGVFFSEVCDYSKSGKNITLDGINNKISSTSLIDKSKRTSFADDCKEVASE